MLLKIYKYLYKLSYLNLILVCLLFFVAINVLSIAAAELFEIQKVAENTKMQEWITNLHPVLVLLMAGIIAPFIETLYAQMICIEILLLVFSKIRIKTILAIVVASMFFGFLHRYNLYYIVSGFITGLMLNSMYILGRRRKEPAILLPYIVHAGFNTLSYSAIQLFGTL